MKKILILFFVLSLVLPAMASAATFSFTPSVGKYTPNKTFTVAVYVNPSAGEDITTAKLSAKFDPSVLRVVSFAQSAGWMPLVQPGYDLIDNVNGKVIKTGGFPSKVKTTKLFGILTLRTLKDGVSTLALNGDAMLLNPTNINKYTASNGANFIVATPVISKKPIAKKPTPKPVTIAKKPVAEPVATKVALATTSEKVTQKETSNQVAAAASAQTGSKKGNSQLWYYLLAGVLVIVAGGLLVWRNKDKNKAGIL